MDAAAVRGTRVISLKATEVIYVSKENREMTLERRCSQLWVISRRKKRVAVTEAVKRRILRRLKLISAKGKILVELDHKFS